jgi:hypothetical protein
MMALSSIPRFSLTVNLGICEKNCIFTRTLKEFLDTNRIITLSVPDFFSKFINNLDGKGGQRKHIVVIVFYIRLKESGQK